ncbi:AEC family transporter [Lacrimispora indolis]|uniref:AEC family transporter n=1 Tax=Lacrimispora indolis TaxID=69825 RepID=UPI0003F64A8E|nr:MULTISPECIES: AEC family transporter [Lachnospiraceae]MBE7719345.1 AEC family transporter [Lacrimispora celerecrescens]
MDLAHITVNKIVEMFIIMLIGAAALKSGIADTGTSKKMSSILLNVITPCMIVMSYQMEFDRDLLIGLMVTVGVSGASFFLAILLSGILIKARENPEMAVERISMVYSNCGFVGIPIISGLLGIKGVFFMTAYITVFNILIWSHGIMLMKGRDGKLMSTIKNFINPSTVAIGAGILFFVKGIRLPEVVGNPLSMIGAMNTPVAMLVSGMNLAESELLSCLKSPRTYMISAAKLLVIPLMTLLLLLAVRVDHAIAITILVASACPSAATGAMFALQYNKNSQYASKLLAVTTVLSLVTIPAVMLVGGMVL